MPESRASQWGLIVLAVITLMVAIYGAAIRPLEINSEKLAQAVIVSDTRIKDLEIAVAVLKDRLGDKR